ncbi:hypothetical protein N9N28_05835 [Rubripirellula amarantea]|uniref:HAMP domain-containing protein n=1 Tax=Rubripirellula amarantea TaxID=2527999 RepID=A0A5C5WWE9_9BACT|nr:hypothetical protein [Rubripirellula amarantea]MDA8744135.1 hypothetical protein [Rubripirellula amarantea]TWT54471.1 hypothetical protein Pla22_21180 [Rubripirellula amarantea]
MHQRSQILVDPKVQWSIAGRFISHWLLFLVCLVTIGVMVRVMLGAGTVGFSDSFREGISSQWPVIGVMVILLPVFVLDTLKLSNRFAGPMYRLRTELRKLATDQPARPVNFRTGDFWLEAGGDFNHVLGQLDRLRAENESLRQQLAKSPSQVETLV